MTRRFGRSGVLEAIMIAALYLGGELCRGLGGRG